jgi:hypothetical protein
VRTVLWAKFPANREKYREFSQICPQILTTLSAIMLNMHGLCLWISYTRAKRNREISPLYQGIAFPDTGIRTPYLGSIIAAGVW